MVNIEEMKQIIHEEKMAVIKAEAKVKQDKIEKQKAEDKEIFKLKTHWSGTKATLTDVARDISPPRSKILEEYDASNRRLQAHRMGLQHAIYLRLSIVALLWLVYVL